MPLNNVLIVASKQDTAGVNITTHLSQLGDFKFYLVDNDILHEENLDLEKINKHDFIIFASKHKSSSAENSEDYKKTLSIHSVGNFRDALYGGKKGKCSPSSAQFMKHLFQTLIKENQSSSLDKNYEVTLEATHHGPLISKPCLFIEIGPSEPEWKDNKAGFVVAKAIRDAIETFQPIEHREIAIGIGGPHYCPLFNKVQEKTNVAISHIIPQYILPIDEFMLQEVMNKTTEEEGIDFALVDWKGIGDEQSRKNIMETIDKLHLNHERVSDILKR